jgi:D-alanyl-D-alanine carboxypeptidase
MKAELFIFISSLLLIGISCEKYDAVDCLPEKNLTTTSLVTTEIAEQISMTVCNTMNANELLGIQVSITDSTGEKWNLSMGSTDLKQKEQLEDYHVFRIGSVTKIYTATLILKLIESGFLRLNQNLTEFYPSFENAEKVQIKHLLNHSSGIKDIFSIPAIFISSSNFPYKKWDPNRLAEECFQKNLGFEPGSKHAYSNTNFILLGLIAEKARWNNV